MAEVNQQQVIDYIKGISVLELSQLVKALESLTMAASRADTAGTTSMLLGRAWLLAGDVNTAAFAPVAMVRMPTPDPVPCPST